ncbi:hypothetical protein ACTMTI_52810 [Nonomuraea sp. H19]|uniref:hypothetical protein n=1 Tax=Nonomuraea sp. H19 TaxID=3452206 RepID=UPI003F8BED6D
MRLRPAPPREAEIRLSERDDALLRVLARDGRAGLGELAAAPTCLTAPVIRTVKRVGAVFPS